ncbi:VPLPA-CTERM sorting domain-containing protein [Arenibacterium halophilum]|uniref:VPLPA-CTERM sorting domain-containing protein n=1 Tax=Arenibacterium halophilum TaxID=2583821 RepID=A0ABY2X941_9RHOB|nr:VPLPA-CTERM sorting domain-containing protein [Arenibacterium halophilum]TMV11685.1 VPLPA-CTERM sorting domain-containing protein [Arenibacterium halophilum]
MMKLSHTIAAAAFGLMATAGMVSAATVDTIDATSGQAGTYFVPTLGQETTSPYYRGAGEDWGWQHNAIASGFTSAVLNISAYDVDESPCGTSNCEVDNIEAFDAATNTWILLGSLEGDNNAFSFTEFDIFAAAGGALIDDIVAGLQVRMDINVTNGGWLVSLAKSVISTDGSNPGNPNPGQVPLPAGGLLLISALGGAAFLRRKKS